MRTPPPAAGRRAAVAARRRSTACATRCSRQELLGSYLIDINAMFFGMPFALFPALAERYGGTQVVGLLWAAPGVGALVSMSTSGWAARVHHNGRAIVLAAAAWGVAIALFGLAQSLWLALLLLALAGAADGISRHLPRRAVERDDPGPHARAPRGRGDDLVVVRAAARQRPRGRERRRCSGCARGLRRRRAGRRRLGGARGSRCRASGTTTRGPERRADARRGRSPRAACRTRSAGSGASSLLAGAEDRGGDRDDARAVRELARELGRVGADVGVGEVRALRLRDRQAGLRAARRRGGRAWSAARARTRRTSRRPCRSAAAPACWNGVAPAKVRNCLAARTPATSGAGPGRPADLPAGDAERLAERGDRQRALGHARAAWRAGCARARRRRGARRPRR